MLSAALTDSGIVEYLFLHWSLGLICEHLLQRGDVRTLAQ